MARKKDDDGLGGLLAFGALALGVVATEKASALQEQKAINKRLATYALDLDGELKTARKNLAAMEFEKLIVETERDQAIAANTAKADALADAAATISLMDAQITRLDRENGLNGQRAIRAEQRVAVVERENVDLAQQNNAGLAAKDAELTAAKARIAKLEADLAAANTPVTTAPPTA